jgi:anti-anti-sigma regulatory factor
MSGELVVIRLAGSTVMVTLAGSHDGDSGDHLTDQVTAVLSEGYSELVINLVAVTSLDTLMIRSLMRVSQKARRRGVAVTFMAGKNAAMQRLVRLWTLDEAVAPSQRLPEALLAALKASTAGTAEPRSAAEPHSAAA